MDAEPRDVRLPFMASRAETDAIDDWCFQNRVRTRAEGIRLLISRGLKAGPLTAPERPPKRGRRV